jgi:hypothetical protein
MALSDEKRRMYKKKRRVYKKERRVYKKKGGCTKIIRRILGTGSIKSI